MSTPIDHLTDATLSTIATQADTVLKVDYADYGLTVAQAESLTNKLTPYKTKLTAVTAKKAEYQAAVQDKDDSKADLVIAFSALINEIYLNPAVTAGMISALGLQPRSSTRTKRLPKTPGELSATPYATGDVLLKWSHGENTYGAVYVVETKGETGDWEQIFSTTKTRIVLNNFTPGVPAWFRIKAQRNNLWSTPSNEQAIYHSGGMSLSLAA